MSYPRHTADARFAAYSERLSELRCHREETDRRERVRQFAEEIRSKLFEYCAVEEQRGSLVLELYKIESREELAARLVDILEVLHG
mgnify:CR=1 FL=1